MPMSYDRLHELAEITFFVGLVALAFRRKSGAKARGEWREPSAAHFFLCLIGALVAGGIIVVSAQYLQDHKGDYAAYPALFGALFGGLFAAGLLLRALIEGVRVVFAGTRR